MSRNRMFDDEGPQAEEAEKPRTTIVGGRPPEAGGDPIPVPTGIQRLLRLASVDPALGQALIDRRADVAAACGVELNPSERAILAAIDRGQLAAMIGNLPAPEVDRRDFLLKTAAAAMLVLGGAALPGCKSGSEGPAAEPSPLRVEGRETVLAGGAAPDEPPPRVEIRESAELGGVAPDEPPPRPERVPSPPGGARPDVPPPKPDGGVDGGVDGGFAEPPAGWDGGTAAEPPVVRPQEKRPTRGIRFDIPQKPFPGKPEK